jgi:TRAP-type C4-dicarboxylate transport system permease small subunit
MRRALDTLFLWAGYLAALFLVVVFALMMIMSLGRQFGLNIPAGDDFAAWCMAAMSFLGLAHTFKRGEMIRVGLLLEHVSARIKHGIEIFTHSVGFTFLAYFAFQAGSFTYDSWRFKDMAQGTVAMPLWIPQLGFVAGLLLLALAFLDELIRVLGGRAPSYEKPPPKTTEELLARVAEGGGV